jgi:hypothetical protein
LARRLRNRGYIAHFSGNHTDPLQNKSGFNISHHAIDKTNMDDLIRSRLEDYMYGMEYYAPRFLRVELKVIRKPMETLTGECLI